MELTELFPQKPEFKTSDGRVVALRVPNLEDRSWIQNLIGRDQARINQVFDNLEWDILAKIVFRLIVDKTPFEAKQETVFDDDGVKTTYLITGPALVMRSVQTLTEAHAMLNALVTAIRSGDPLIDAAIKAANIEKKSTPNQTGVSSSKSVRQSTATPRKRSAS